MTNIFRKLLVAGVVALSFVAQMATAFGAEVSHPTSLFDAPSEAAKQLSPLKRGTHLIVIGEKRAGEDFDWFPVELGDKRGWVKARSLKFDSTDQAAAASLEKPKKPLRLWASIGPTHVDANGSHFGARMAAGIDFLLGSARKLLLGTLISHSFTGESLDGRFSGTVARYYFFPTIGYFFVPETFWIRSMAGFAFLTADNQDVFAKLKPALGFGAGYKFNVSRRIDLGVELTFEHSGSASSPILYPGDSMSCALGDCSATGTVPRANIWSINFVFGFNP